MAGYMGYDPDALDRLVAAMRTAVTELTQIRTTDIEAAGPLGRVRAAQATLETTWLPIVTGMRGCVALTGFTPTRLDGSDVRASELFVLQGYGWEIVTDPGRRLDTDTGPVTASEARAIAALLSSPRAQQLLDTDEERSWLSGRLERIAADPQLADQFRRNLDPRSALATIADARLEAAGDRDARATGRLDDAIAACAAIASAGHDDDRLRDLVTELDPYAGALVIRSLDIVGSALGELTATVLQRWRTPPEDAWAWPDEYADQSTADLLLPLLVDDPAAAREFLLRATDDPGIVFGTTDDRTLVSGLLLAGTDPSTTTAHDAGSIIVPIFSWLATDFAWFVNGTLGDSDDVAGLLAPVVAPWLLYFGARADEWGWSDDEADDALAFALHGSEAMDAMIAAFAEWRSSMRDHPIVDAEARLDVRWVSEFSMAMDQLERAFERAEVAEATRRRGWVVLVEWVVEEAGSAALSRLHPVAGPLAGPAIDRIDRGLVEIGWLPPTVDTASELARADRSDRVVTTAVLAMVAVVEQLAAVGQVPADALRRLDLSDVTDRDPSTTHDRLLDFVTSVGAECSPAAESAMFAVLNLFLPPYAVNDLD